MAVLQATRTEAQSGTTRSGRLFVLELNAGRNREAPVTDTRHFQNGAYAARLEQTRVAGALRARTEREPLIPSMTRTTNEVTHERYVGRDPA
jgi:hypothetical protein